MFANKLRASYFGLNQMTMRQFAWSAKQEPIDLWHIVKGDFVQVISGRYKATQGKVLTLCRKTNMVTVQGANLKFKVVEDEEMQRRRKTIKKEFPIHVSNVQLVDPSNNEATKIKYGYLEDGTKVRISKKSGAIIPKPDRSHLTYINRTKARDIGINDTRGDLVLEKTYTGEDFFKVKMEFEAYLRMKEDKERLMVFKNWLWLV